MSKIKYIDDYLTSKWGTYYDGISYNSANMRNINNTPTSNELDNITNLMVNIYDPICDYFNLKIPIHSTFRGKLLNFAVGGASNSQHKLGEAMDIDGDGTNVKNSDIFMYFKCIDCGYSQ